AVMDAFAGFNPNTFGQLCGMVEGGGCMVLMTPPSEQWGYFADPEYASLCVEPYLPSQLRGHYLLHLVRTLESSPELLHWAQGREPVVPEVPETETVPAVNLPCRSRDQQEAVALVLKASGARRQPLVLSADRGRGKSAALGIAAAELLRAGKKVVVTAVSRNAIDSLLERVETLAPDHCHLLHYYRPDELLRREEQADLLLVDEAAAIPTPLLLQLLDIYPRVVFATTLHGYEGNGQGFALRFLSRLRTGYPRCREYRLSTPIRWTAPDPLEQLGNRMLLLDVDAGKPGSQEGEPEIVCVDRQVLVEDTALLRDLFGLLVLAHYRTTPGDLRILLDSPNMRVYLAHSAGAPLGCVLLAEEGPLPDGLAQAVWEGRRRPRGHLLPQTLIAQEGWLEVAPWRSLRVVRIAVHPAAQKRGIGRRMLRTIERDARAAGVDYLGASFAASDELLAFWQGSGFLPLRLGEQRDPVAGPHALLVLKPLSAAVQEWLPQARRWYRQSLLQRIPGVLQDLEPELLPALLRGTAGGGVL
ncbi:tRNA(Met) cytidine acetyltransferase TmcA, partial [Stutzerimonas frequens]|uniref:tRNA(Met) cytidine acetyltransferase TmcA n=1 Tax=Stutzerimonas frequens TaxID=2968969 RepID=UPI0022DD91AB